MNGGTSWSIWPIYVYGTDGYRLGDVMSSGTPNPTIPTGKWWSLPSSPPIFLILNGKSTKNGIQTKVATVEWWRLGACCVQVRACKLVTILVTAASLLSLLVESSDSSSMELGQVQGHCPKPGWQMRMVGWNFVFRGTGDHSWWRSSEQGSCFYVAMAIGHISSILAVISVSPVVVQTISWKSWQNQFDRFYPILSIFQWG